MVDTIVSNATPRTADTKNCSQPLQYFDYRLFPGAMT
jgi:hypothetical protein